MAESNTILHIVTFAVPYPANYGGAIDAWNRILALHAKGIRIKLHCFLYGGFRSQRAIKEVVEEVYYYPRVVLPLILSKGYPYIVSSRKCKALLKRLKQDQHPILFDGIHTTGFFDELSGRTRLLRAHNIEHQYYGQLADEAKGVKSLVYKREAICLQKYETALARKFDHVFAIAPKDYQWYKDQGARVSMMPPYHGHKAIDVKTGRGKYILCQGDLSIEINQLALFDLLDHTPNISQYLLIVAGRAGNRAFEEKLAQYPNIERKADVSDEEMIDLVRNAQLNIIHTLHRAGMKLKLFTAFYHGRFILGAENSRTNTPLDHGIVFYQSEGLSELIKTYWEKTFTEEDLEQRKTLLTAHPGDLDMAGEIIRYL